MQPEEKPRDVRIRPGRVEEARALCELASRSKASWGYPQALLKLFEKELTLTELDMAEVMVVEIGETPIGFYSLQPVSGTRVELGHLFVEPAMHRRGVGRLMIADALQRAAAGGYLVLEIQGDPNAAPFYTQLGAKHVGERESESVPGRMLPLFEIAVP